jgi:hypothetical protein
MNPSRPIPRRRRVITYLAVAVARYARRVRAWLGRARERNPAAFRVRGVLALLLVLLLARLLFGDNPWEDGVAERVREGKNVRPVDYARTWGWWTSAAIAPVLAALYATVPRWLVPGGAVESSELAPPRATRLFVALTAGAMLLGAWLGLPRLSMSLFEDERYNVQWSIDGYYYRDGSGELRFHEPTWSDTLWHYKWPNNHVPHTILARLSVGAWRGLARQESRLVNEPALRLPAFVAGIASIGALALLLGRLGYPGAGVAAGWILAVHPWHLRYLSEARGYSLALLLTSAACWGLVRALHRGTWGRWALYGASQFLLLWTYPGALLFVVVLNLATASSLICLHRGTPAGRTQALRWALANLAGALLWIRVMAPNMAQFASYLGQEGQGRIDARVLQDAASYLLAGMQWGYRRPNPHFSELSDLAASSPVLVWTTAGLALALVVLGASRLVGAGGVRARMAGVFALPPLVLAGSAWVLTQADMHPHYFLLGLPGGVALLVLGLETGAEHLGRRAGALVMAAAVLAYAAFTHAPRRELRTRAIEPFRESVELCRPTLDPLAPENAQILTATYYMPPLYYDPLVHKVATARELRRLMQEAEASGRALFVNVGRPALARRRYPEVAELAESDRFEEVAMLYGLSSRGHRQVFRYRGKAKDGAR